MFAARLADLHAIPTVPPSGGPIAPPCCPTVIIEGMPAARVGDTTICPDPACAIAIGSMTVIIAGQPAARMGDLTLCGGQIAQACTSVIIGD